MDRDEAVVERMQALIERWEAANDLRAIFLRCYVLMTRNMLAALTAQDFEDNLWVASLLRHFADYYFKALDAYDQEQTNIPPVWGIAFDATRRPHTHVLQNLVLGVNAHINYDLVFALEDMLRPEWQGLSAEQRRMRYHDHCHVNDIISQTIDSVQDQIIDRYSVALEVADVMLGPLDEWMTSRLISLWRDEVWEFATKLSETDEQVDRVELHQHIEQRTMKRAHSILGEEGVRGLLELI